MSYLEDLAGQIRTLTMNELAELRRMIWPDEDEGGAGVREPAPTPAGPTLEAEAEADE